MQDFFKSAALYQGTIDRAATFALCFNYVFYQIVTSMISTAEYFILSPETEMKLSDTLSDNYRKRDVCSRKSRTILQAHELQFDRLACSSHTQKGSPTCSCVWQRAH